MKKEQKTVKFEGAGWADADSSKASNVTNCRIRGTFLNNDKQKIYLEMGGFPAHGYMAKSQQGFKFPWHISHLFKTVDHRRNWSADFKGIERETQEYTKENILKFINEKLNCSFDAIEILNDSDFCGFSHTGKPEDDFHNDKPDTSEYQGWSNRQTWCVALTIDQNREAQRRAILYASNDDMERGADLLRQYCRMHLENEIFNMAPWAWENCDVTLNSIVNWEELNKHFKDKEIPPEPVKPVRKKADKTAIIEQAAESLINGQRKQAISQLKSVSVKTLVAHLNKSEFSEELSKKLLNLKVGL